MVWLVIFFSEVLILMHQKKSWTSCTRTLAPHLHKLVHMLVNRKFTHSYRKPLNSTGPSLSSFVVDHTSRLHCVPESWIKWRREKANKQLIWQAITLVVTLPALHQIKIQDRSSYCERCGHVPYATAYQNTFCVEGRPLIWFVLTHP